MSDLWLFSIKSNALDKLNNRYAAPYVRTYFSATILYKYYGQDGTNVRINYIKYEFAMKKCLLYI